MNSQEKRFYELVQQHERQWGNQSYYKRPELVRIMEAEVVLFWYPVDKKTKDDTPRYTVTLHNNLEEVEQMLLQFMRRSLANIPERRISAIFHKKQEYKIKRLNVVFEPASS